MSELDFDKLASDFAQAQPGQAPGQIEAALNKPPVPQQSDLTWANVGEAVKQGIAPYGGMFMGGALATALGQPALAPLAGITGYEAGNAYNLATGITKPQDPAARYAEMVKQGVGPATLSVIGRELSKRTRLPYIGRIPGQDLMAEMLGSYLGQKGNEVAGLSPKSNLMEALAVAAPGISRIGMAIPGKLNYYMGRPGVDPIIKAEAEAAANKVTNAANITEFQSTMKQLAETYPRALQMLRSDALHQDLLKGDLAAAKQKVTMGLQKLGQLPDIMRPAEGRSKGFSFLDEATGPQPLVKMTNTLSDLESKLGDIHQQLPELQPRKTAKIFSQFGSEIAGQSGPEAFNLSKDWATQPGAIDKLRAIMKQSQGQMPLDQVQTVMQGLWEMSSGSNKQGARIARSLFPAMYEDLNANPAAKPLIEARANYRKHLAMDELADRSTGGVDKQGNIHYTPEKLQNFLDDTSRQAEFWKKSLSDSEMGQVKDTLAQIFRARTGLQHAGAAIREQGGNIKIPPELAGGLPLGKDVPGIIPNEPTPLPENIQPQSPSFSRVGPWGPRIAAGLLTAGVAHGLGAPLSYPFLTGEAIAGIVYPNVIFRVASDPRGRMLLKSLFRDRPPSVRDYDKMATLGTFLASQRKAEEQK